MLADHFQKTFQVALLASTHLDTRRSLLQAVLYELNRPYRGMDEGELRLSLVDYITLNDDCARRRASARRRGPSSAAAVAG